MKFRETEQRVMKRHGKFFLKRIFSKGSTGIILLLHLAFFLVLFLSTGSWNFKIGQVSSDMPINSKINSINDFFARVFPNLIIIPLVVLNGATFPLSGTFWGEIEEVSQKTQEDGTDLFFLSTEIPTSRKQIFGRKVFFITSLLVGLHLIITAFPLALLLGKNNYFSNFTGLQTFLFLGWNFLITPLLLLTPLVIFLFSLASLKSIGFIILKGFGRLSFIFIMIPIIPNEFLKGLSQNYLLTTLTIMGIVICLAVFTLSLAYKNYQKKDLK